MLHVFLPGFSLRNADEEKAVCDFLISKGLEVYPHRWLHWDDQDVQFDEATELSRILGELEKRQATQIGFIGKSIGSYETLFVLRSLAQSKSAVEIKYILLMGIPVRDLAPGQGLMYPEVLSTQTAPITIIQNDQDNHGSADDAKNIMVDVPHTLIVKPASDHSYAYLEDIYGVVSK